MGWDYQQSNGRSAREILTTDLEKDLVKLAFHGRNEAYAAMRGRDGTYGVAIMITRAPKDRCDFGYKVIHESMGPSIANCPAAILDLLSPPKDLRGIEYAERWRERCRANLVLRKSLKGQPMPVNGDTVIFAEPVRFEGGTLTTFTIRKYGRKVYFLNGEFEYRISNWRKRVYILEAAA